MNSSCTIVRKNSSPLDPSEIEQIFASGMLYEMRSFFIIDPISKTYRTDQDYSSYLEEALALSAAFKKGYSLIIKNLENFNRAIRLKCAQLGPDVDVHLYLVPPSGGSSFDFHSDDRDVLVHLAYGEKKFITREHGTDAHWSLSSGDELFIPQGVLHRAIPKGPSALLSFGIPRRQDYPIPGGLRTQDLGIPSPLRHQ